MQFQELDCVRLKSSVKTTTGQCVPEGTLGVVLVTWDSGASYEVEFEGAIVGTALVDMKDIDLVAQPAVEKK